MADKWRPSTWGEEISLEYGKSLKGYRESDGNIQVFGSNGAVGWTTKALSDGPGVILGRKGAYRGVRYSKDPFFVIDTAYYVKPKTDLDMQWLYYSIIHHKLGEIDDGSPIPSTTRAAVYVADVDIPPFPEQKAIAHILGSLDDKIELNRRMNATLEGMAQALFKSWFVDFDPVIDNALAAGNPIPDELAPRAEVRKKALANGTTQQGSLDHPTLSNPKSLFPATFQFTEDLGWIPEGWEVKRADEAADISIGKTPPRKEAHWFSERSSGNITWVSIKDLGGCGAFIGESSEYLTPESVDQFNVKVIPKGSVLLSFKLTVGRVSIAETEMTTNEAIAHFVAPKFGLTKEFLYSYLKDFDFSSLGSTSSIATAVNSKIIKSMPMLVPSREALNHFEDSVGSLFRAISVNTGETKTLTTLRDTLLPKLISGELRLPETEQLTKEALT